MHNLTGKGVFISPQLRDIGDYSYIVIDPCYEIDIEDYVAILHTHGLKVLTAVKLSNPELSTQLLSRFINSADLDGVILSSECCDNDALIYLKTLRDACPDIYIGFCAYRFPSIKNINVFNFLARCDAAMPYYNISRLKDPVPQMRRILKEWREITSKEIVPIINPGKTIDQLVDYLSKESIKSICLSSPNGMFWGTPERHLLVGVVSGTEWLGIHKSPDTYEIVSYYHKGESLKIYELSGKEIWARTDRGWSNIVKDGKNFLEF